MRGMRTLGALTALLCCMILAACSSVDDDRIQNMPVNIALADAGLWNTFGVSGFGSYRNFIYGDGKHEPKAFHYSQTSATGFGGVLLISGMDPFSGDTDIPLAYDLACPVERDPSVRVRIESETFNAECPACGSVYDVTTAGGTPLSGPAAEMPCALRRYRCLPTAQGGYIITN